MLKQFLLIGGILGAVFVHAQDKSSDTKKTEKVTVVSREAKLLSVESVLADGKLCLTRTTTSGGGDAVYTIQNRSNPSFNAGKPYGIKLSKEAFDTYFQRTTPELAQKWPQLMAYVQEKKLSLDQEQAWISVLNYYNSLK